MTSAARVGRALAHQEADRVPFYLSVPMHPAGRLGLSLRDYFGDPKAQIEGQLLARAELGHDVVGSFGYAAAEIEAFGGSVVFHDAAPPNTGAPPLKAGDLETLEAPEPLHFPALARVVEVTAGLARRLEGEAPVAAIVLGPLSLPVVQLGFERYLDLLVDAPHLIERLWRVNGVFCARWANAHFAAGAAMVAIAEPLASPTLLPLALLKTRGRAVLAETVAALKGAFALATASAPMGAMVPELLALGAAGLVPSCLEDLARVKASARGRAVVLGGLNGLALSHATRAEAEQMVRDAIAAAAPGGGFVIAEHHAELPLDVSWDTLHVIAEAVRRFGRYAAEEVHAR